MHAEEEVEANGAIWAIESGVILTRDPASEDWELWDPDGQGPLPPTELLEATGGLFPQLSPTHEGPEVLAWARDAAYSRASVLYFLERSTYLGGSVELPSNLGVALLLTEEETHLVPYDSDYEVVSHPIAELTDIHISGPGEVTTDAGMWGGGFGVQGAVTGIAMASIINTLTSRTSVNTFLKLEWVSDEAFLHHTVMTPEALRMGMSRVFIKMRASMGGREGVPAGKATGIVDEIERLAKLYERGLIDNAEFAALKRKLIN